MKIGVLALQGDFARHVTALERCRDPETGQPVEAVEVRLPDALADLDGLIIPGGESTTLLKLMDTWGFAPAIKNFHAAGRPIFGTCAGAILLARDVVNPDQPSLGLIDVGVERNAYGRQHESFEARGVAMLERPTPVEMVFIRAPRIRRVGPGVRTLATHAGEPVAVEDDRILVATFHPELTDDSAVHQYFCGLVHAHGKRAGIQRTAGERHVSPSTPSSSS